MAVHNSNIKNHQKITADRARSALQMLFVGDSLSMPVHWYYRPMDIWRAFPPDGVRKLEAAPANHPSSIMSLHSTSAGGRATSQQSSAPQIVGDVILKGRAKYWNQARVHYHHGLEAGENTLNTWCAHLLINWMLERASSGSDYEVIDWLNHYVEFMIAEPPRHPDTYAESYHRGFFANLIAGQPIDQCGAVTHDTPSMGALVTVAPLALALLPKLPLDVVQTICRQHVWSTHPDKMLLDVIDAYVKLMSLLLSRTDEGNNEATVLSWLCDAAAVVDGGNIAPLLSAHSAGASDQKLMRYISEDMAVVGQRYSLACYITDSWPSVCYLAARHYLNPKRALLVNTNLGGENAHRGSVLGTVLGLINGSTVNDFYSCLANHSEIDSDIDQWINHFYS